MPPPISKPLRLILGTEKITGPECTTHITRALALGYRRIDTAQAYQNESAIGLALRTSPIPRSSLFITTKISAGFKKNPSTVAEARESARSSIERLGGDYVDLMLVHQPGDESEVSARRKTWEALEGLVEEGSIKRIGVCNFSVRQLEGMKEWARILPEVVQMELHPWHRQHALERFCSTHGMQIQAHSALARNTYGTDPRLGVLAAKYAKSPAQMLIRYSLQKGWTPVVRARDPVHLAANAQAEGFEIENEDIAEMSEWDKGEEGAVFPWLINE